MGKTFKRNEGRRPKWNKHGRKSHKQREYEEGWSKNRPHSKPIDYQTEFPEDQNIQ